MDPLPRETPGDLTSTHQQHGQGSGVVIAANPQENHVLVPINDHGVEVTLADGRSLGGTVSDGDSPSRTWPW